MRKSSSPRQRIVTNRLWRYRTAQQLSQKQVARLLGHKSASNVSRWENGVKTPTLESAIMLGHILKAPVEALFADRAAELRARIDIRRTKWSAPHKHARHDEKNTKTP